MQLLSSENTSTCVRKRLEVQSCLLSMMHGCLNNSRPLEIYLMKLLS
uniref:Alternative protein C4orf41 n=1 Tax=Homo sapiens TaxID=9606 RepID=L8EAA2_HUMAN|nr:alternative protein C4orf41 [Homo sapiens]